MTKNVRSLKAYAGQIHSVIFAPSPHLGAIIRELMQFSIGSSDALTARTPAEALEIIARQKRNLLLIEIGTDPAISMELIRAIRRGQGNVPRNLPVIAMTGAPTKLLAEQLRDLGVNEILVVPVTAQHLTDRIKSVFEKPRDWVLTQHYVGPDRRRKKDGETEKKKRRSSDDDVLDDALTLTDAVEQGDGNPTH